MQTAKFAGGVALVAAGAATFYAGGGVMLAGGLGLLGGGMAVKPTGSGIIDRSLKSSLRDPGHPSTAEMAQ